MRVLVYGGRDYADRDALWAVLDRLHAETAILCIVYGGATGADRLGADWAVYKLIALDGYPANWAKYGHRAGPLRNQRMLDEGKPQLAVQCPGGRGTADMRRRLDAAGVPVVEVPAGPSRLTGAGPSRP